MADGLTRYRLHEHTAGAVNHPEGEFVKFADLREALQAQQGDALDVERYRFLRARTVAWNTLRPPEWRTGEKLDAAIDAAMLAARREG